MKDCQKNTPISETQLILEQFEQDASYIKTGCIYFALIGIFHWLHPEEELSPDLLRKVLPKSGDRFTMPAKQLTPWLLKLKEQGLCISLERIHLFSENTPPIDEAFRVKIGAPQEIPIVREPLDKDRLAPDETVLLLLRKRSDTDDVEGHVMHLRKNKFYPEERLPRNSGGDEELGFFIQDGYSLHAAFVLKKET